MGLDYHASQVPSLWTGLILVFMCGILVRKVAGVLYTLYYHPLAKFPGPRFAAISNIPFCYWFLSGRQPFTILSLHEKYGPVVRVAPNELSFNSAQSWKDIYASRPKHRPFIKSAFYDGGSFADRGVHSIVSERNVDKHSQMRYYLSHAFSERSLAEQEDLINETIDKFVSILASRGSRSMGYDISKGYEMATFDIIGALAFGESFGGVESDKPHIWISVTLGALMQGALVEVFKRFMTLGKVLAFLLQSHIKKLVQDTATNEQMAIDLVNRRIKREDARHDFMTRILERRDPKEVSDLQLAAHASDFVLAGSETTATALGTTTYYLLKTPAVMKMLSEEIRGAFQKYEDITDRSTQRLPYLRAVILEGMRMYPPLPFPLPRVVPEGGDTVDGHFLPSGTIVSTNPLAASLDARNFKDPLVFKPERWLGENSEDATEASQPFSLGPRGCLGRSLGWLELRTILCKILWTYDLEMVDESLQWHRDSQMHTLWRKPELRVKVKNRGVEMF
ncbi:putative cytochrome P450 [Xylaria longipes]|nr:putative cytochrome P450 [Xylaria longipes]